MKPHMKPHMIAVVGLAGLLMAQPALADGVPGIEHEDIGVPAVSRSVEPASPTLKRGLRREGKERTDQARGRKKPGEMVIAGPRVRKKPVDGGSSKRNGVVIMEIMKDGADGKN